MEQPFSHKFAAWVTGLQQQPSWLDEEPAKENMKRSAWQTNTTEVVRIQLD